MSSAADQPAEGADGFLFHRYDDAFEQLCGSFTLSPRQTERWVSMLESRHAWCHARGIAHVTFIVPEKHVVYQDNLPSPYRIAQDRPVRRILQAIDPNLQPTVVYPEEELRAGRAVEDTYFRTDVHWTQYGAFLGYKRLEQLLAQQMALVPIDETELERRTRRGIGGLGMMLDTEPDEEMVMLSHPRARLHPRLLANQAFNVGQVEIYESAERRDLPTCVLFRDSNATPWLPYLCAHFSRLVVVASSRFFYDAIRSERPDVVIMEITERYLARRWPHGAADSIVFPEDLRETDFTECTGVPLPLPSRGKEFVVRFGSGDASHGYLGDGWSDAERDHTWTIGRESWLRLPLVDGHRAYELTLSVWPCIMGDHDRAQRLEVSSNGVAVGSFEVDRIMELTCAIPAEAVGERDALEIRFHHPDCIRPADRGGTDARELAIAFNELRLRPT